MPEDKVITDEDVSNFINELERTGQQDIHQTLYGEEVESVNDERKQMQLHGYKRAYGAKHDMVTSSRKPTTRPEGKA